MTSDRILRLLKKIEAGRVTSEAAARRLKTLPYENLGFAAVDHHRVFRQGMPEAIFCEGKTVGQAVAIARRLLSNRHPVLATRVEPALARALLRLDRRARYEPLGRTVVLAPPKGWDTRALRGVGHIVIMTAGTADVSVAEEARVTAQVLGDRVTTLYDVGVAGLHRLLDRYELLETAKVLVVVAGMDGALPSVVGGMFGQPVIAVPTSRGYGASFGGLSALLAMLNSCAAGVGVVNIDNGYGAACLAHRINSLSASSPRISPASSARPAATGGRSSPAP
jgi:pyridinium-3,5-biscarboxylic acid mononucleotide synthase